MNGHKPHQFLFLCFSPVANYYEESLKKKRKAGEVHILLWSLQAERHVGHQLWIEFTMRSVAGKNTLSAQLCFKLQINFLQQLCELVHVLLEEEQ